MVDKPVVLTRPASSDSLWGVIAWFGTQRRVAEIFASRLSALADCEWRERQVRAYIHLLRDTGRPVPIYGVAPVRRSDLPPRWKPLPALGFLRSRSI